MKYMVAPSYQNGKITKIDEENKKAYVVETCYKCGGSGQYAWFGECFACNGLGKIGKWVKAYTEEEYEKYLHNQEKAKERRAEKEKTRQQDLIDNSEVNKKNLLKDFGYDPENPTVYIVAGENTYAIKDELKEAGARFNPTLGWYFQHEVEVPEGYTLAAIPFDNVFNWFPLVKRIEIKENAKEIAEAAVNALLPKSNSEYVGEVKDRMRDLEVTFIGCRTFESYYGTTNIYTFDYNGNILVWLTTSCKDMQPNEKYLLTATVKEHSEYKGVKQTKLSRCIIKNI